MRTVQCAAIAAVAIAAGPAAHAEMVELGALKDNTIYDDGPGVSNGAGQHLFAGKTAAERLRRGLLAFDIASMVPAGAMITDVTLTLHLSRAIGGDFDVAMHRLLADWGEGASDAPNEEGAGAPAEPGDATWMHTFYDTDDWATQGGDFAADASATTLITGSNGFFDWSSPDLITDAQYFLDNPTEDFGWILLGDEAGSFSAKRFDTRENPTEAFRPVLTVTYVPGPGGVLMIMLAGVRRRRRR